MAGPRPDDSYNPVQAQAPSVGMPNDYLSVRANPNAFGAQVGQALEGTGKVLGQMGDEAMNIAVQRQGMINETLSTDAETQAASAYGAIMGKYKSMEGLQAVHALPQTVSDLTQVRQTIRATLPNVAAQRSFDLLAARRESYALGDINNYAATQIKVADTRSASAALNQAIDSASDYSVASSDVQSQDALMNVKFQAARVLNNQGYGEGAGTGMKQDAKGNLTFSDTPEGNQAKDVYDDFMSKAAGKIWENRITTLANDPKNGSVTKAVDVLARNKDDIPSATYAKLSHMLAPAVRSEQARGIADDVKTNLDRAYATQFTNTSGPAGPKDLVDIFANQESGNGKTSANIGQIQPDTWSKFAKPGENINNSADNRAVMDRMLNKYTADYDGDTSRVAVAYFSGPGNVAPVGSPTPYLHDYKDSQGKSVSSYVDDIKTKTSSSGGYQSQADYIRTNYTDLVQQARDKAREAHPDDATFEDQAVARTQQHLNDVIRTQELQTRGDQDLVLQATKGKYTGNNPLTNSSQINLMPKEVRDAWDRWNLNDPYAAKKLDNLVSANSRGKAVTYGTDFYKHFLDVANGTTKNPVDLMSYIDPANKNDSPLTNTGYERLSKITQDIQTPEGHAFIQAESNFLQDTHRLYTGGALGGNGPTATNKEFNQALQEIIPKIEAGKAAGKTPEQLFSPKINGKDNPDYITAAVKPPSISSIVAPTMRVLAAPGSKNSSAAVTPSVSQSSAPKEYGSLDELKKADIPRAQKVLYARNKGWIGSDAPEVPRAQ
jgi:hypothetical protein